MVKVCTRTFNGIFDNYPNLCIPEYQRPYRWTGQKLDDLLDDLEYFFIKKPVANLEYYLGSIILFRDKAQTRHEIIDGQQRIATLILIQYVINGQLQEEHNLSFNNHVSFNQVKMNIAHLERRKALLHRLSALHFLDRMRFTVIATDDEDSAFSFFDSQNNRGVTLGADDFLKAYHLREVRSELLQEALAQQWEQAALASQAEDNKSVGLLYLFYKMLYRARQWKGQKVFVPDTKDSVLAAFQKSSLDPDSADTYKLFPCRANQRSGEIRFSENGVELYMDKRKESLSDISKESLPFALRQPIFKGHNFFLFVQKYTAIYNKLFTGAEPGDPDMQSSRSYYEAVYRNGMSDYLRQFMELCLLMYYDVFGKEKIGLAAMYFDYFIGSIRVEKYYVRKESVKNSLIEQNNNLLDVIATAYLPEDVFQFIAGQEKIKGIYETEKLDGNGVRGHYKKSVLRYFNREEKNLKNRLQWIR